MQELVATQQSERQIADEQAKQLQEARDSIPLDFLLACGLRNMAQNRGANVINRIFNRMINAQTGQAAEVHSPWSAKVCRLLTCTFSLHRGGT